MQGKAPFSFKNPRKLDFLVADEIRHRYRYFSQRKGEEDVLIIMIEKVADTLAVVFGVFHESLLRLFHRYVVAKEGPWKDIVFICIPAADGD